jgi:hypothetical protein
VGFRRIEILDFLSAVIRKSTYLSRDYTMHIISDIATQTECHPHGYLGGMSVSIYLIKPLANVNTKAAQPAFLALRMTTGPSTAAPRSVDSRRGRKKSSKPFNWRTCSRVASQLSLRPRNRAASRSITIVCCGLLGMLGDTSRSEPCSSAKEISRSVSSSFGATLRRSAIGLRSCRACDQNTARPSSSSSTALSN